MLGNGAPPIFFVYASEVTASGTSPRPLRISSKTRPTSWSAAQTASLALTYGAVEAQAQESKSTHLLPAGFSLYSSRTEIYEALSALFAQAKLFNHPFAILTKKKAAKIRMGMSRVNLLVSYYPLLDARMCEKDKLKILISSNLYNLFYSSKDHMATCMSRRTSDGHRR